MQPLAFVLACFSIFFFFGSHRHLTHIKLISNWSPCFPSSCTCLINFVALSEMPPFFFLKKKKKNRNPDSWSSLYTIDTFSHPSRASLVAQLVKNLTAMRETWVWSLGWEDPLERKRLPTPVFWPGEFHGVAKSQTWLSDFQSLYPSKVLSHVVLNFFFF